jgi:sigma-B regulation protein RsbU (phosphoserine phosphatase)
VVHIVSTLGAERGPTHLDLSECKVLVVDDDDMSRELLVEYLKLGGYNRIITAEDGLDALTKLATAGADLVVLDIGMPGMDGIEVCRRLTQGNPHSLPIMLQTAFTGAKDRTRAFAAGATDFITKPVLRQEFLARVKLHLEHRMMMQRLEAYHGRVAAELALAQTVQFEMLPSQAALERLRVNKCVGIASHLVSSSELGGDLWGLVDREEDWVGVFLADVSGHGVIAALNSFRLDAVIGSLVHLGRDPAAFLGALSVRLSEMFPASHFVAMFYGVIDLRSDELIYAGAASTSPLLLPGGEGGCTTIEAFGLPLGAGQPGDYVARTVPFPPGSTLVLYSDVLIETPDRHGVFWDESCLSDAASERHGGAPDEIVATILDRFHEGRPRRLDDDLTLVVVQRQ